MELRHYLATLRRHLVLIVLTMGVALGVAWNSTPKASSYSAEATIYVGARQLLLSDSGGISSDALAGVERLILTYSKMITSEPIAQAALDRTGIERSAAQVVGQTAALPQQGTQLLRVRVTDPTPRFAQDLANAVASAFVDRVQDFEPTAPAVEGTVPSLPAYVFERAKLPTAPEPTGLGRNLALGIVFGALAGAAAAFLREYLDVTIKSPADAEQRVDLPVLGVIPYYKDPVGAFGTPAGAAAVARRSA